MYTQCCRADYEGNVISDVIGLTMSSDQASMMTVADARCDARCVFSGRDVLLRVCNSDYSR